MNTQLKNEILKYLYKNKTYQLVTNDIIVDYHKNVDNYSLPMLIKYYGCSSLQEFINVSDINIDTYFNFSESDYIKWKLLISSFQLLTYHFKNVNFKILSSLPFDNNNNLYILPYTIEQDNTYKSLFLQNNGIKCILYNKVKKKIFILEGYIENNSLLNSLFVNEKIESFIKEKKDELFHVFLKQLSFHTFLIYDSFTYYLNEYNKYCTFLNMIQKQCIEEIIQSFLKLSVYNKKNWLFYLLIDDKNIFCANLAIKLFYTLNSTNFYYNIEQTSILNLLPISLQSIFKENITKFHYIPKVDSQILSLEDKIKLLKVNDSIKEKAYMKYNEVLQKNEENYTKSKTYLEGLLKIPFGVYKQEPILNIMNEIKQEMLYFSQENLTNLQIHNYLTDHTTLTTFEFDEKLLYSYLNGLLKELLIKIQYYLYPVKIKNKKEIITTILSSLKYISYEKILLLNQTFNIQLDTFILTNNTEKIEKSNYIKSLLDKIPNYIKYTKKTLDNIIYGQEDAKTNLQMIFSQWINGAQQGYCFGFEGLHGVGKTTLGKGISQCLMDENNNSRPFHMIQIGGSSNGSLLHGHNYTYVSSTWGCLVQILMDSKVMNPIIFIDEVDKISKTENGKEIIHILIHLLDSTQNTQFQDKYFSGIPLDFSKVLFILSYNDPTQIDKILLDRIHRIKFKSLKLNEKIEISKQFILPQIYSIMGLNDNVLLTDDIIEYIIEIYTDEPGVRKLKELFFELIGNINLKYLENNYISYIDLPIIITKEDIDNYLKNKYKIIYQTISNINIIGRVYGLWVNQENKGGILPIQISFFPSKTMNEFKLTGMQGDVMKESMNVSLSLILNMLSYKRTDRLETNGIHIHCPEGATPKNGPSAGLAITCALYSLLENKIIPSTIAMTGEISLDGNILPIGGLEYKILGGIKAGVQTFFYPKENERDVKEKQENICYCPFNNIVEVLQYLSNL